MEVEVALQLRGLGISLLLGAVSGAVYDLLRLCRHRWRGRAAGVLLDLLFWCVPAAGLVAVALQTGTGLLRGWDALFLALGCGTYLGVLSPVLLPVEEQIARMIGKVLHYLLLPLRKICSELKKICKILKNHFH